MVLTRVMYSENLLETMKDSEEVRVIMQGVLLLNRALTVKPGEPASHSKIGWHEFTEVIISNVAKSGAIGVLWGSCGGRRFSARGNKSNLNERTR